MEVLCNSTQPVKMKNSDFFDTFDLLVPKSDEIILTSGYVSADSTIFIKNNINKLPNMSILAGMHHYDGFTKSQYNAYNSLSKELISKGKGNAYICKAFPFHGKVYTFLKNSIPFAAIVGSSNMSHLSSSKSRIFEVDLFIDDTNITAELYKMQMEVISKASIGMDGYVNPNIIDKNNLMDHIDGVERVNNTEYNHVLSTLSTNVFQLELKCENKSNMNVFFGKGRTNTKTGLTRPRPWYEVEVIVSNKITSLPGYPCNTNFTVYTDDGYKFDCTTNGDYSKNFRTHGDLKTLGSWIKGRLEDKGILNAGEFITEQMLHDYGQNYIELTATNNPNIWHIDFSGKKGII